MSMKIEMYPTGTCKKEFVL